MAALKGGPGQMQPMSRALRPGTSDEAPASKSAPLNLGKFKGPKTPKLPSGPTQLGKGVAAPKFARGGVVPGIVPKGGFIPKVPKIPKIK